MKLRRFSWKFGDFGKDPKASRKPQTILVRNKTPTETFSLLRRKPLNPPAGLPIEPSFSEEIRPPNLIREDFQRYACGGQLVKVLADPPLPGQRAIVIASE